MAGLAVVIAGAAVLLASYGQAQSSPEVAPGLRLSGGNVPLALDKFQGKPELVPVHHSTVEMNNHKGANLAGSLAGSVFYKPKITVEVAGAHARTTLHDARPAFYVRVMQDPGGPDDGPAFAILHAIPDKDRRVFAQIKFTQLTGNAKRNDGLVDTTTEKLPDGWVKVTPNEPLTPGEYALAPVLKQQNAFSTVVYDFALNPAAPNAPDAVLPEQ